MNGSETYYDVLQVDERADPNQVEEAYRRLSAPLRPIADGDPLLLRRLRVLDEAFLTLTDPRLRARYNASLHPEASVSAEPAPGAAGDIGDVEEERLRRVIPWAGSEVLQGIAEAIALFVVLSLVVLGVVAAVYGNTDSLGVRASELVLSVVLEIGLFTIAWSLTVRRFRVPWRTLGYRALQARWLWVPAATAIASYVVVAIVLYVYSLFGYEATQDTSQLTERHVLLPLAGLMVVLAAPLAEETFFRGLVFGGLLKRFGLWPAALASGLLFGAAHVTGAASAGLVLPFGFIGALFAYAYYRTGSLWANIGAHFLFNAISFSLLVASSYS